MKYAFRSVVATVLILYAFYFFIFKKKELEHLPEWKKFFRSSWNFILTGDCDQA